MLRRCAIPRFKHPRNADVGPEYDRWFEKYDSWAAFNKMRKLAGTGFYVPPEWYQHFRMFPPPHNLAREEHTMNPYAHDPHIKTEFEKNEDRQNLRDALGKASRGAASAGNRYMNIFWIQKPLDEMERSYYAYTGEYGMTHEEAFRRVVDEYYAKQAVSMRVRQIQREEVAMTGKCLSMKEGIALIHTLSTLQKEQLPPQEYATLSDNIRQAHKKHSRHRTIRHRVKKSAVKATERMLAGKRADEARDSQENAAPEDFDARAPEKSTERTEESLSETKIAQDDQSDSLASKSSAADRLTITKEEETESIEAHASSLENATFSVVRERIARQGSFESGWYSSVQEENPTVRPVAVEPAQSTPPAPDKGKPPVNQTTSPGKPLKTPEGEKPKEKLLKRSISNVDFRKI